MMRPRPATLLLLLPWLGPRAAEAMELLLASNEARCVREAIPAKSLLTGEWRFTDFGGAEYADGEWDSSTRTVQTVKVGRVPTVGATDELAALFNSSRPAGHFSVTALDAGPHQATTTTGEPARAPHSPARRSPSARPGVPGLHPQRRGV